jgi:hypothetical protein
MKKKEGFNSGIKNFRTILEREKREQEGREGRAKKGRAHVGGDGKRSRREERGGQGK